MPTNEHKGGAGIPAPTFYMMARMTETIRVLIINGPVGVGKSTTANTLSKLLEARASLTPSSIWTTCAPLPTAPGRPASRGAGLSQPGRRMAELPGRRGACRHNPQRSRDARKHRSLPRLYPRRRNHGRPSQRQHRNATRSSGETRARYQPRLAHRAYRGAAAPARRASARRRRYGHGRQDAARSRRGTTRHQRLTRLEGARFGATFPPITPS
jgi:hypothetical protein